MPYKDLQKRNQYQKEYGRKWRKRNPQKVKEYLKRYREKHIQVIRERRKKRRLANLEEYRRKDREAKKGWRICINCGNKTFGYVTKKYCEDCQEIKIEKLRERMKGNQYWKLRKKELKGAEHPNWRGGLTFWKKRIWNSAQYKKWRLLIFQRDNWTCQKCGEKGFLEAHHTPKGFAQLLRENNINTPEEALNCDKLWKMELGITLCRKCHNLTKNGRPKKYI